MSTETSQRRRISKEDRIRATLLHQGNSFSEIGVVSKKSLKTIIYRFNETKSHEDRPRSGKKNTKIAITPTF